MKLAVVCVMSAVLFSGCAFIMQDGENVRYYGIREQDAHTLTRIVTQTQEKYYGPAEPAPVAASTPASAEKPAETQETRPPNLK